MDLERMTQCSVMRSVNPLAVSHVLISPLSTAGRIFVAGIETSLIVALAGLQSTPTTRGSAPQFISFAVVVILVEFTLLVSLAVHFVIRYGAIGDRVNELGVLRVLGAEQGWIRGYLLQESLMTSIPGLMLGFLVIAAAKIAILYTIPSFIYIRSGLFLWVMAGSISVLCDFSAALISVRIRCLQDVIKMLP